VSAPVIWILIPFLVGGLILLVQQPRTAATAGGSLAAALALLALFLPIDRALLFGSLSFKISSILQILGRSFAINAADGPLLAIIYGTAALWFFGSEAANAGKRFVPLGLAIVALLVASIAVEPFLFAAPMFEIAALLTIPLLVFPNRPPGRGAMRFLIYQTFAMPFILFSGWMLAGVEASPGDISLTVQSGIMLGLGFAFLFAVFPLYNWIPMVAEEASPYVVGFLLWALPTLTVVFAMGFMDRYTWLRTSPQFSGFIQAAGLLMAASGGILAAFERHLGRLMGYAAIVETGLVVLAISLNSPSALEITFLLLIPRGLMLAVWGLALSVLRTSSESLRFSAVQGLIRAYPIAAAALMLAHLSATGFPLLAGFPSKLALWEQLARQSLSAASWMLLGLLGLLVGGIRTLAVFAMAPEKTPWKRNETWIQGGMLGIGVLLLFVLGLFPQILLPFLRVLPSMFEHIGQ
jgi:formate hydrogenlyase subunit 3/multisubunit Na+/H+ antiporter MnhD subunit